MKFTLASRRSASAFVCGQAASGAKAVRAGPGQHIGPNNYLINLPPSDTEYGTMMLMLVTILGNGSDGLDSCAVLDDGADIPGRHMAGSHWGHIGRDFLKRLRHLGSGRSSLLNMPKLLNLEKTLPAERGYFVHLRRVEHLLRGRCRTHGQDLQTRTAPNSTLAARMTTSSCQEGMTGLCACD